ncbi:DUF4230 domain-containing protein [Adlercreutzia sp. ZJ141]|uniref:DUF4230 domain-containing protein n=1 Tax=Adlercreutzia sp. ZJ141 TaxID=2709406 RepID=UPI0013EB519D|nr:DUF4230 domain-containing protein [Adlercreutzia sp. ZJ141]
MKLNKVICVLLIALVTSFSLSSCVEEKKPNFSGCKKVAELATLECTFHNVAEIFNDGTDMLFGINVGYKKAWFEYDGKITIGIDASKVSIEAPDANGLVIIHIPNAQVLGLPDADETTFSDIYSEKGLLTKIEMVDQEKAYEAAQAEMKQSAENNPDLMWQARSHAETILEQYVIKVGESLGQSYKVEFADAV